MKKQSNPEPTCKRPPPPPAPPPKKKAITCPFHIISQAVADSPKWSGGPL